MPNVTKSPWIMHYDGTSCNGCDIEVLACLTPLYDVERFGVINTGNPKHADILLITGSVNYQNAPVVRQIYEQMNEPKVVCAIGVCACNGGVFKDCYNVLGGVDKVIPVDIYVPGCAARPESIIDGVVQSLALLQEKSEQAERRPGRMNPSYTIEDVDIKTLYRMMLEHLRAGFRLVQIGATGREDGTELIYSVAKDYQMDNFRVFVESGEIINSISDIFPSAALFENEIAELFGVNIDCINLDFHGKFYRIDKETPFCKAPMGENVTIVKKTEGGAENG